MILVIGATGRVGGAAVRELVRAGVPVRGVSRDPSSLAALGDQVEPVPGDIDRPETLVPALAGVQRMFYAAMGQDPWTEEATAIRLAEEAGVEHFVFLSSLGVEHGVGSGPLHQPGEERLRSSGLGWTILRPIEFMSNTLRWLDAIHSDGVVREPTGNGRRAMIDPADIGAVAAKVLTSPGHEGETYELTGPESLTTGEYAAKLSAIIGKPVTHEDIPPEVLRDRYLGMGMPPPVVGSVVGFYTMIKAGDLAMVTPDVEDVLGRPGRTFDEWAREHAAAFG